jgi:superfamily I DNA/RNA helicase
MQDFVESRREEDMGDQVALTDFLQEVSLLTDLDSEGSEEGPKVSLMTVHSAKGLEFPTVFVVGLEENIFPSPMCTNSMRELEEERRLLYVAITRAEKHCILTCAQNRFRSGVCSMTRLHVSSVILIPPICVSNHRRVGDTMKIMGLADFPGRKIQGLWLRNSWLTQSLAK